MLTLKACFSENLLRLPFVLGLFSSERPASKAQQPV